MTEKETIENLIEAALFFKGGTMSLKELAAAVNVTVEEADTYVKSLAMSLEGRGLRVVYENGHVALGTAPSAHEMIEKMRREELDGPLGKAGLETLAIVMFKGPLSRSDIEYVRGVNSTTTLRTLLIRGLIERAENPKDKRSFIYQATAELPAYFGISTLSELPAYEETRNKIDAMFAERDAAVLVPDVPEDGSTDESS
jgi:segregation and condensation protein B